jgi:hypothetical protein
MKKYSLGLVFIAGFGMCALLSASTSLRKVVKVDKVTSVAAYKFAFMQTPPPPPTPIQQMTTYLKSVVGTGTITQVGSTITVNASTVGGSVNYVQASTCNQVMESSVQSQFLAAMGQAGTVIANVNVPSGAQYMVVMANGFGANGDSSSLGLANAMNSPNVSVAKPNGGFTQFFAADTTGASNVTFQNYLNNPQYTQPICVNPYTVAFFVVH